MLIAGFAGCSGKSGDDGGGNSSAAHGGSSGAGRGGSAGTGGSGTNKGGTGGGGTGGTTPSEGGAAGAEEGGGRGGSGARGGFAGSGVTAGSGGSFGFGGSGGIGARGGAAGTSAAGTSAAGTSAAGTSSVPNSWYCAPDTYNDGTCDCGCGIRDPDCKKTDIDHCERCNASGSCAGTNSVCPGRIDPMNTTACIQSPPGWYCSNSLYSDGKICNCGCGVPDPDCKDATNKSCDSCNDSGSCAHAACPSDIDDTDNSTCSIPAGWLCSEFDYGDAYCDCGCGVVDPMCKDATAESCDFCPDTSCAASTGCAGHVEEDDNSQCSTPPPQWRCPARLYHDGSNCDCGCGYPDPDCSSREESACDRCDAQGSCSGLPCPGIITTDENDQCTRPAHPPDGWTCPDYLYADGYTCDCGCGVPDADCHGSDISQCKSCVNCSASQDCGNTVLPTDITQCRPPAAGWTCAPVQYHDGYSCDCGCGIKDPDCASTSPAACNNCPAEGCTTGICSHLSPTDNSACSIVAPSDWTCDRGFYADGVCDCGCGVADPDCSSASRSACETCNDTGSCSTAKCPGTISTTDNSTCTN
ncbi:MAG TPA: hypothetical protein VMI54_17850 [Polyangiaceae bacterium]|nr:hypothetical protein [Polyangiaceae bacterium]